MKQATWLLRFEKISNYPTQKWGEAIIFLNCFMVHLTLNIEHLRYLTVAMQIKSNGGGA